jgi:hypothetical protein
VDDTPNQDLLDQKDEEIRLLRAMLANEHASNMVLNNTIDFLATKLANGNGNGDNEIKNDNDNLEMELDQYLVDIDQRLENM